MNSIAFAMNDVFRDWKEQYDVLSVVVGEFSVCYNHLCFEKLPLCRVDGLRLLAAEFDSESIVFVLTGNRKIIVEIEWSEDQGPIVVSVSLVYQLID